MSTYVYKRFRRLAFYFSEAQLQSTLPFQQLLTSTLTEAYSIYLRGPSFAGIHSINLYLFSDSGEQERVEQVVAGYLDCYVQVDVKALTQSATDQQRQHYLLAVLQRAVRRLSLQRDWDSARFEQAYHACLLQDLPVVIRL